MSNQAGLGLGDRVHTQELNEYPDDWKEEYARLSDWVRMLAWRHRGAVQVRLIDVQSLVGFWKMLRYRVRRCPAVILPGGERFCGWEALPAAEVRIAECVSQPSTPVAATGR